MYASTPTARQILGPAYQPGAFATGVAAGQALRSQRDQRKAREDTQAAARDIMKGLASAPLQGGGSYFDVRKPTPSSVPTGIGGTIPSPSQTHPLDIAGPKAVPSSRISETAAGWEKRFVPNEMIPQSAYSMPKPANPNSIAGELYNRIQEASKEHPKADTGVLMNLFSDQLFRGQLTPYQQESLNLRRADDFRDARKSEMEAEYKDQQQGLADQMIKSFRQKISQGMSPDEAYTSSIPEGINPSTLATVENALSPAIPSKSESTVRNILTPTERRGYMRDKVDLMKQLDRARQLGMDEMVDMYQAQIDEIDSILRGGTPTQQAPQQGQQQGQGNNFEQSFMEMFKQWQQSR